MLTPGQKLGPYEVTETLGAGGMGEVYRARDQRLGRDVAIKVLPASFAADRERLQRFEQEARAAAALNHPNILAVFDLGTADGSPYLVSELLEGSTLRERIQSRALPARKATDYALQIAHGLAAAHNKGIVHRDLKPENLFITDDNRVKILDFGLAKLTRPEGAAAASADAATMAPATEAGVVLGTMGYMSPEQVRGKPADARSDLFALGVVLYEMVSGKRAFHAETPAETMSAILKEEPPPLLDSQQHLPAGLARIVEHCLEKNPADRFQSASDVAFALEAFSGSSSSAAARIPAAPHNKLRIPLLAAAALALAIILFAAGRKTAPAAQSPIFHQLTFQRGTIYNARFAPDGETVVYAAAWDGKPAELFTTGLSNHEWRSLGIADADLMGISASGDMAVRMSPRFYSPYGITGTLARGLLSGGQPRPVENDIQAADFSPDGKKLMVVRDVGGRQRLEYPIGHVLYETASWIGNPRISPDGNLIAFIDHLSRAGDPGDIAVVDLNGQVRKLATGFVSSDGLAWSPDGKEVWFTATRTGSARPLYAVSLSGHERLLVNIPGALNIQDVSSNGRVLLTRNNWHLGLIAWTAGWPKERDLSYMDFTAVRGLSADGKTLLFDENGEAGGTSGVTYVRKLDSPAPVRLADMTSVSLSADGKWVLGVVGQGETQIEIVPTGTGESKILPDWKIEFQWAAWLPGAKDFLFTGNEHGHAARLYRAAIDGSAPQAIGPEGVTAAPHSWALSRDGKSVLVTQADGAYAVYTLDSGKLTPVTGMQPGEQAIGWSGDDSAIYVYNPTVPASVYELDRANGRRKLWKQLVPPDATGVYFIRPPVVSADGKTYAYNYNQIMSDLYILDGVK